MDLLGRILLMVLVFGGTSGAVLGMSINHGNWVILVAFGLLFASVIFILLLPKPKDGNEQADGQKRSV